MSYVSNQQLGTLQGYHLKEAIHEMNIIAPINRSVQYHQYRRISITLRHAHPLDDKRRIAELIYQSDSHIFPYWFKNNREDAIKHLITLISTPGSYFDLRNIWVITEASNLCGFMLVVANDSLLDCDYQQFNNISEEYWQIVQNIILPDTREAQLLPNATIYLAYFAIDAEYRRQGIGTWACQSLISLLTEYGYQVFRLYCRSDNPAVDLYKRLGFECTETFESFQCDAAQPLECYTMEYDASTVAS